MRTQVLIIGAGPVCLTMAAELARYGVAVRIVDKAPQATDKSKALVLWSRTLELLDRGPGSARFVEAGFKAQAVNIIAGEKLIDHVEMGAVDTPYPYGLMLPQCDTERLLDAYLGELGVSVKRGEGTGFTSRPDGIDDQDDPRPGRGLRTFAERPDLALVFGHHSGGQGDDAADPEPHRRLSGLFPPASLAARRDRRDCAARLRPGKRLAIFQHRLCHSRPHR